MTDPVPASGPETALAAVIVPDTTPLILLAAGEALGLLQAMGRVVVPDVVRLEATRLADKPFAPEITAWLAASAVEAAETDMGELYALAVEQGKRPPRHAGELSMIEWLADTLPTLQGPILVVADDDRVPRMLAVERLPGTIAVVTTRALLDLAQEYGLIASADVLWSRIEREVPTANPSSTRTDLLPP